MRNALRLFAVALCLFIGISACLGQTEPDQETPRARTASLGEIRQVAAMIPGRRALRINVAKFAESLRSRKFSVKGAPDEPSVQARTVFQVVYPDGYVMVDSGMDEQIHKFFGRGTVEPYYPEVAQQVQQALRGARFIVVTHEHGDHVAGVIRTPFLDQIAPKTILTRTQVQTLMTNPQMPDIRLTPDMARRYIVVDYEKYLPLAPGFVLIKAPGHTPGSQMIYVALESGREYLFVGDSAWLMDNIRLMKGKDAPWIKEDDAALSAQLKWLNEIHKTETNLFIVVSHDDEERKQYIQQGVLGGSLELTR
ncbi:MAG TPA: MBL fold metallo-hydrolase [Candidatus Acidoferrales bacterium]|nr:MBL fold metallo-hydrolase [Candidatus Acidoferrales bacterium]